MKQISFVVPCYNSESYMEHCIDSLLPGGNDVEIIIIDDGSKDNTGKIADEYAKKYPDIVKVHHQENGGHGEGINQGLKIATGKYFKVIDSDDWVDSKAYKKLLKKIKKIDADLIVMNYVYVHNDGRENQVINFSNVFPENREITWDDIHRFKRTQYLSLHSLMYKKSVLDKAHIKLPKHTFYEDNLFIYLPLKYTKTIYYMNLNFYQYFIGRADQSVQVSQLVKRSDDQRRVTVLACNAYDLDEIENKKLRNLMLRELSFLVCIGCVFTRLAYTDEAEKQAQDMMDEIKKGNPKLYKELTTKPSLAYFSSRKGKVMRGAINKGFKVANKLVGFD